ncbi:uncharacterized protein AlacWU_00206 [Aspergillus niger]|uniref:uncharacterized protein n=1 Tax=Aspergillus lacticoffeatus (strain CBS 101883) TaxID=1450533 RepID=UPI000D7FB39B|nr:uncharacterized protein BO96DRAFT_427834 [Aspergillus niger CBS 101883]PYH50947.1 hypothetical protein BO96DRAFT_427834 [Aspergillus niger CBS 101883]GJP87307.1 uncharacterized protein AlacWU_00206 [Aspergillus niger]
MASGVEEPSVERTFVVNNANESDPNLDHRDLSSQNLEDDDVPPIQSTSLAVPYEATIAASLPINEKIDIQPCGQPDVGGRKSVLESSGLSPEPDHFNMEMLRLLSLYPADTSRYRRFRHIVHRKGVVIVRRQLKIMSRCVSEALRASDGSINGTEFMRLVLRHHPYYGQTIIAATVLRQLIRRLAKTNRRSLLNIVETVIRHWVIQKDLSEFSLNDNDYTMSLPSACVVHIDVDNITKSQRT